MFWKADHKEKAACTLWCRLNSKVGESAFLDCFNGAVVNAGAAVNAQISIDNVLAFALSDSLNGAVVNTSAAANASVSNNVSHDFPSIM